MNSKLHMAILTVCVSIGFGMLIPNSWANTYDDAERSAKDLLYYYEDFRQLDLELTKKLVVAISEANEEELERIAARATGEAKYRIDSEFEKVKKRKDEALGLLKEVRGNPEFREKFSDVDRLIGDVNDKFNRIAQMPDNINPVNNYLGKAGLEMEQSRHGGCDAYEFETGSGKLDCARVSGCFIIEFKPDNPRAVREGEDKVRGYRKALLDEANKDKRSALARINSDFGKCQDFRLIIEAYRLGTEIKDDGRVEVSSASWSTHSVEP